MASACEPSGAAAMSLDEPERKIVRQDHAPIIMVRRRVELQVIDDQAVGMRAADQPGGAESLLHRVAAVPVRLVLASGFSEVYQSGKVPMGWFIQASGEGCKTKLVVGKGILDFSSAGGAFSRPLFW